jgi:hypothetical protein
VVDAFPPQASPLLGGLWRGLRLWHPGWRFLLFFT